MQEQTPCVRRYFVEKLDSQIRVPLAFDKLKPNNFVNISLLIQYFMFRERCSLLQVHMHTKCNNYNVASHPV